MNEQTRNEIIRRLREGQSIRGIAGDLQLSRETVKLAIERHRRDPCSSPSRRILKTRFANTSGRLNT